MPLGLPNCLSLQGKQSLTSWVRQRRVNHASLYHPVWDRGRLPSCWNRGRDSGIQTEAEDMAEGSIIGWRRLIIVTTLATISAIIYDRIGLVNWIDARL